MKLTDKRFWKFEAIVLVCTSIKGGETMRVKVRSV